MNGPQWQGFEDDSRKSPSMMTSIMIITTVMIMAMIYAQVHLSLLPSAAPRPRF